MLDVTVITGRTTEQGTLVEDKLTPEYFESVSYGELNEEDFNSLGLVEGDRIRVKTEFGEAVLFARKNMIDETDIPRRMIFIPMGPYANQVVSPKTEGTGTPLYKGLKGTVEKTEEKVLTLQDILG